MASETIFEKLDRISRKGYPTTASVEVTSRCNARCGYCYLENSSFDDISTDRLCFALNKLSEGGVYHLHLTGGEPFLREDILTLLAFAFDHGIFHCTLFSNGTLLNDEHRNFLVQNRDLFRYIQMSVFSHVPAVNDAYFGIPGAFETIVKNALFLKENGLRISLSLSVFDFNVDALEETHEYFKKLDLPLVVGHFKAITGPRIENLVSASTTYSFYKRFLLSMQPDRLSEFKNSMIESLKMPPQLDAELCRGRWSAVLMNSQGDLAPCLAFRNLKLGNIFEDRAVHDILQDAPDYHTICTMKRKDMKKCIACKFFNFCILCLGSIHTENGSFCTPIEQVCNFAQAVYDILE